MFLPGAGPAVQIFEFNRYNGGLQGVQPEIPPDHIVVVFRMLSMIPQHPQYVEPFLGTGGHDSAVSKRTKIL